MGFYNDNRGNQKPRDGRSNSTKGDIETAADKCFSELTYSSKWIKEGADEALITFAEKAGKFMAKNNLTNSKIRSIYGEIKRIQMGDFKKEKASFYLLKPKVAYAFGRDEKNEGLKLFKKIFDICSTDVNDQETYHNFCNLIEAILAYHKAHGGKD